jgi:hypothetical protein
LLQWRDRRQITSVNAAIEWQDPMGLVFARQLVFAKPVFAKQPVSAKL